MTIWTGSLRVVAAVAVCLLGTVGGWAATFEFHHEQVMGTSLDVRIDAANHRDAEAAEAALLAEIDRLSGMLSEYSAESDFSKWSGTVGEVRRVPPEMFQLLERAEHWQQVTGRAFSPSVAVFSRIWKQAERTGSVPTAEELDRGRVESLRTAWRLNRTAGTAVRLADNPITLNAIAKGAIVEWSVAAARRQEGVHAIVVNCGGDLRVAGDRTEPIRIADPFSDAVNAEPVSTIFVRDRAVATSGGYRRGFTVGGQRYSHVIDPRTGKPVEQVVSATVVARSSADADALATAFNVLDPADSLKLAATLADVDCLIIDREGARHVSAGWSRWERRESGPTAGEQPSESLLAQGPSRKDGPPTANDASKGKSAPVELLELEVKFELARVDGGRYRRPYVAVWLEDKDEFPVRTAVLWMQTRDPGPRWHKDLLRWYRGDALRRLVDGTDLIGTISSASRGPGEYKALFNGRDDAGKPLRPGDYTLFIEVAREHGTYQLIRQPVTLGKSPIASTPLKPNVEIKAASFEYRAPKQPARPATGK